MAIKYGNIMIDARGTGRRYGRIYRRKSDEWEDLYEQRVAVHLNTIRGTKTGAALIDSIVKRVTIRPLEKPKDTGVECPECKAGHLIERKSRYGKLFYSCNTYPKCKYATWNPPVAETCPKCGWPILTIKTTKRRGTEKVCPQKECGYSEVIAPPEAKTAEE